MTRKFPKKFFRPVPPWPNNHFCPILSSTGRMSWETDGTEARREKVTTPSRPTWWTRNGHWRRRWTCTWWGSSRSQWVLFSSVFKFLIIQAGLVCLEALFGQREEEDEPEPLRMEHFYFPLGLWLGGFLLSSIFLLAEIFIHRIRKSQTKVAMMRLEEAAATQSTPESENLDKHWGQFKFLFSFISTSTQLEHISILLYPCLLGNAKKRSISITYHYSPEC